MNVYHISHPFVGESQRQSGDPGSGRNALAQKQLFCNCDATRARPVLQDCFARTGGPYGEKHKPIVDPFFGSGTLAEYERFTDNGR